MRIFGILGAAFLLSTHVLAEDVTGGPGEQPVEAYSASNTNAGAKPLTDPRVLKAFHGAEGVGRVVDKMIDLSVADPKIGEIFVAQDLVRLRRTLKEQFLYLLGAPVDYTGRDMKSSHQDLGVQTRDLNILIEHLRDAMGDEKIPFWAQNKLLGILAPMKKDVVTR